MRGPRQQQATGSSSSEPFRARCLLVGKRTRRRRPHPGRFPGVCVREHGWARRRVCVRARGVCGARLGGGQAPCHRNLRQPVAIAAAGWAAPGHDLGTQGRAQLPLSRTPWSVALDTQCTAAGVVLPAVARAGQSPWWRSDFDLGIVKSRPIPVGFPFPQPSAAASTRSLPACLPCNPRPSVSSSKTLSTTDRPPTQSAALHL